MSIWRGLKGRENENEETLTVGYGVRLGINGGDQMKSLLVKLGVVLVITFISNSPNSFAEIEIRYDTFKDKTTVQTDLKKTWASEVRPALALIGSYDGQTPLRPKVCQLAFISKGLGWAYLDCHSLSCLADGKPVELAPSSHYGRAERQHVVEFITVTIPFSVIEQLSKCKKVQFKLCNTKFTLIKEEMQDLRTFIEAFTERR